jgi:hypothetical protein
MSTQSQKFTFSDVEWSYTESREISRNPNPPMRTGVQAVTVSCLGCGHAWRAKQYGQGRLRGALGGVIVTCPSCSTDELVDLGAFG